MSNKQKGFIFGAIAIIVTAFILFLAITQNEPTSPAEAKQNEDESEKASPVSDPAEQDKSKMEIANKEKDKNEEKTKEESKEKEIPAEPKKDATKKKKSEEENISFEKKYITVASLNLRSDPNAQSDVLGVLMLNEEIQAAETTLDNGWVKVKTKSGKQ
ncbi:SH3 domain-containing protein [Virgibacillus sp. SK37]|uniref:SH3 domain-containing protein n=1 Tax=Virgibacillus sp. SK37 TaxID=403957 RepID=UPI0004D1F5F3|nr:SH3 domain-containing protein [Virgibacillus sp. SK37]AIF45525.1 hypothetical protein X953_15480 [Virgibacillus sp. SK37]